MARIKNQNLIIVGGKEPVLQEKSVEITENGTTTYTADAGFDGLKSLEITTNVDGSGGGSENEIALIENTLTGVYNIPDGVTYVGEYGLAYRKGITELNIPSSVTALAPYALYNMSELKRFTIPYSVTGLGNYSCYGLSNLEEVVYNANMKITALTSAGSFLIFANTTGIFRVGEDTTGIPDYLFSTSSSSNTPRFKTIIAERNKVLTIGQKLIGSGADTYLNKVWLDCGANTLTLKTNCFGGFNNLRRMFLNFKTATVSTPFSKTGTNYGLTLKFGNDVTTIPSSFSSAAVLKNVYVPSNVATISSGAFNTGGSSYQTKLTGITIDRTTPPTLANTNAFTNTNNCPIYVPAESVGAYQGATNWSTYASRITALSCENYSDGTNSLSLGNNLWFDLFVDGVTYNGTYTNTNGTLSLSVFDKNDDSTFSGTIADGVATITINGTTYTLSLEA